MESPVNYIIDLFFTVWSSFSLLPSVNAEIFSPFRKSSQCIGKQSWEVENENLLSWKIGAKSRATGGRLLRSSVCSAPRSLHFRGLRVVCWSEQVALQGHFGIPVTLESVLRLKSLVMWLGEAKTWSGKIKSHRETFSHTVIPHT